jgi:hypothetical protein
MTVVFPDAFTTFATTTSGLRLWLRPVGRVAEIVLEDAAGRVLARMGAAGLPEGSYDWGDLHDLRTLSKWEPLWDCLADLEAL